MDIEVSHAIKFPDPGRGEGKEAPLWLVTTVVVEMSRTIYIPVTIASISLVGDPAGWFRNANNFS